MAKLSEIRIEEPLAQQLHTAGIRTTEGLLGAAGGKDERREFARQHGIDERQLLEALNRADLARIKGVSTKYADLLETAGIDTVPELAQRNPENLHAKLKQVNEEKNVVQRIPRPQDVKSWVAQAKEMERTIHY